MAAMAATEVVCSSSWGVSSPHALLGSSITGRPVRHKASSSFRPRLAKRHRRWPQSPSALFGGGDQKKDKKKFITKEEEPDQYWQTSAEKEGKGPMSTVLPYIVIFGFLTPFIILGIAFANGWVKVPVR